MGRHASRASTFGRLRRWAQWLALAVPLGAAAAEGAAEPAADGVSWAFNGFGTYGVAHSSEPRADFVFDNLQPKGTGASRNWDPDLDSRLGLQLSATFGPHWSALLQMVSEYRWNGSYNPYVNWANIKVEVTPDLSLRVGRIALPSFMASNSRRVGYSNVAVRPPPELYRLLAVTSSDGIDVNWRIRSGEVSNTVTALYGKKTVINTRDVAVHSSGIAGLYDTLDYGALTLHVALQQRDVDNQKPPRGSFVSFGASYDPGPWLLAAEWVKVHNYNGAGLEAVRAAWDLSYAYRLGALTPYAMVARLMPLSDTFAAPAAQSTVTGGLRWDCRRNLDLKLQFEHLMFPERSVGTLQNFQKGFVAGGHVNVVSVTADFLF